VSQSTDLSGRDYDPATQPKRPDRTLGELFGEMTSDVSTLLRKEIELAKVEAREEATRLGKGAGMFAGAGVAGWLALLFLSFALAWLLDQAMNTALAFAIVGVLWALAALVLVMKGKQNIKSVEGLPTTVQTLKEDVEWAKQQKS
jgi:uncharacterized membrane protein YqjE